MANEVDCTIKVFTQEDLDLLGTLMRIDKALFPPLEQNETFLKWEKEFNTPVKENE